jgi:RimJ/RimL family protein N-acetyltransferase
VIVTGEDVCRWVAERTGGSYYPGSGSGIGCMKDGQLVAGVLFDNWTGRALQMHVASDGTRRWMTREFLRAVFAYPFEQLKLNKVIGVVDSTNADALRFDHHLGFVTEAVIKDAGKHGDLHILSMTRQQCRFLRN